MIPGTEVNSTVGHIAALFVTSHIPKGLSPIDAVKAIHDAGGLAMAVHPYHSDGIKDAVFDAPFDIIETECGSVFYREAVARNSALTDDKRLAGIAKMGSSDAHYIRAIGNCYTVLDGVGNPTPESIRQAIEDGRCAPRCSMACQRARKLLGRLRRLG